MPKNIRVIHLEAGLEVGNGTRETIVPQVGEEGLVLVYCTESEMPLLDGGFFLVQPLEDGVGVRFTPCGRMSMNYEFCSSLEKVFDLLGVKAQIRRATIKGVVPDWSIEAGGEYCFQVGRDGGLRELADVCICNIGEVQIVPGLVVEVAATDDPHTYNAWAIESEGEYLLHADLIPEYLHQELNYKPIQPANGIRVSA